MSNHTEKFEVTRVVSLESMDGLDWDIPQWGWEPAFEGKNIGVMPLSGLSIAAGRPAAGKSSFGRWVCAQVTRGLLPGVFFGTPHKVAYIAGEESLKYNVLPGLQAAGADLSNVRRVVVQYADANGVVESAAIVPERDMAAITKDCIDQGVKFVVVDPLMQFVNGSDIYKNNEVREQLRPWVRLAEDIDGVVLAIMHLNKSGNGDVVAGINGSSAFGEVARCVIGFTKTQDGDNRVMSVEKNSIGEEGAAWTYQIKSVELTNKDGLSHSFGAFELLGESSETVGDVLRDQAQGDNSTDAKTVVLDFLEQAGGSAAASDVQSEVKAAGLTWKTVQNKRRRWGIETKKVGDSWVWYLKGFKVPTSQTSLYTQDLGTLGPSQVTAQKQHPATREHPNIPTSHAQGKPGTSPTIKAAILNAISPTHAQSLGAIMRQVNEATGNAATVPDELDRMESQGLIQRDLKGRYLSTAKESA